MVTIKTERELDMPEFREVLRGVIQRCMDILIDGEKK